MTVVRTEVDKSYLDNNNNYVEDDLDDISKQPLSFYLCTREFDMVVKNNNNTSLSLISKNGERESKHFYFRRKVFC